MERDVFEIVVEKDYIALSPEERIELKNYCSTEEEYNQLKRVLVGMNTMDWTNPKPKDETKERLDVLFAQSYPKAAVPWYNAALVVLIPRDKPIYRQPLLQIAALALLVFLTVPFLQPENSNSNQALVAENTTQKSEEFKNEDRLTEIQTVQDSEVATRSDDNVIEPISDGVRSNSLAATGGGSSREGANEFVGLSSPEATVMSVPVSNHPDGVFIAEEAIAYSLPASDQPDDVMDLLTTTF